MDISGVNNGVAASTMIQMKQAIDLDLQDALKKANADTGNPLGTSLDFSRPSELLSKLEQLKNENPDKFKELMKEISDVLKTDAAASGLDSSTSTFLSTLSDKFASVASTGDLSQLQAAAPAHHHHGHHAKAASQYDSNSGSQESLLEALMQQAQIDGSAAATGTGSSSTNSGTDASATLNKVQALLAEALQLLGVNNG